MAKKKKNEPGLKHLDAATVNAASSTDFTGLIPANLQSPDGLDAYKALHAFGSGAKNPK